MWIGPDELFMIDRSTIEDPVASQSEPKRLTALWIVSTPGIVIDGKVVHAGGAPTSDDLQCWLQA